MHRLSRLCRFVQMDEKAEGPTRPKSNLAVGLLMVKLRHIQQRTLSRCQPNNAAFKPEAMHGYSPGNRAAELCMMVEYRSRTLWCTAGGPVCPELVLLDNGWLAKQAKLRDSSSNTCPCKHRHKGA